MIPRQPFGATAHISSRVIFGAAALGGMSQARADATMEVVLEHGINHIDTAASYGSSEVRLHSFLQSHRADVFLATKTGERTSDAAREELERSLERMGVDQVDLVQLHNLVEPDEFEVAHGAGGAVEALVRARDEGLVRFIGVTGHGTQVATMHRQSIERFPFDSVLLPYNHLMMSDPRYAESFEALATACQQRNIALQTIKSVARRRWPDESAEPHFAWYEPLPEGAALERGVRFVLGRPQLFLNSSSDARLLPAICAAANHETITVPTADELDADVAAFDMSVLFDDDRLERI